MTTLRQLCLQSWGLECHSGRRLASGWKTLGPLLFLGEVIFHFVVFYFSRKYYAILVAAAIVGDNQTLLASQTKHKTLLEVVFTSQNRFWN